MFDTDKPITKAADDLLNRATFAEHLAQTLINYSVPEGFVIGLYGKWGSGKTSVLNMIIEQIEKNKKDSSENAPIILRFNPWLCSDPNQLISQFFKQLSSEMKLKGQILENVCKFINNYAGVFEFAKAVPFPYIGDLLANAGKIVNEKAKDYMELRNNDLQQLKNKISKELLDNKIKIIVTIDDIDRLSNEEIVSVFQLVKSLADFPYTIYLLSFDRDIVVRALAEVQKGDGAEYLEKVVQVPFELPAYDENSVYQIFYNKMNIILNNYSYKQQIKIDLYVLFQNNLKHYLNSIRAVTRFVNTFALKYELLKNDTYFIDLIELTCLQIFEPEVFSRLRLYKHELCGDLNKNYINKEEENTKNVYNAIIKGIQEEKKSVVCNILLTLFPKLSILETNEQHSNSEYNYYVALNNGYISCLDCFDRYFSLILEPNEISIPYARNLIVNASKSELLKGIYELNANKKIIRFIDYINTFFQINQENINYPKRAELLFTCLMQTWHQFEEFKKISPPFPLYKPLPGDIALVLLPLIKKSEIFSIVSNIFNNKKVNLSTITILLNGFEYKYGRLSNKREKNEIDILTLEDIENLENIFVNRVMDELQNRPHFNNQRIIIILDLLKRINSKQAKDLTNKILKSDVLLVKSIDELVEYTSGGVINTGINSYRIWNVNRDNINRYIDITSAYNRIIKFTDSYEFKNLAKEVQINIGAFLIRIENYEEVADRYGNIKLEAIEKRLKEIGIDINADSPDKP